MNPPQNIRVLVVEDEILVAEMIQAVLEQLGCEVVGQAGSGEQALEMTRALEPDVILMDIGLPDMDGVAAARRIAEVAPTPVVILSAYDSPSLLDRATAAGIGAYLVKPADAREIERGIAVARARFDDMMALRELNRELGKEIAERERAEEALRASEEKLRMAVDYSHDWEYWLAADGSYVYVSPACERITGYRRSEFQANPILLKEIVVPEDREEVDTHLSTQDVREPRDLQFRIVRRDGEERWIEHVCQPVYGRDGAYLGRRASNRDVTDRRRLELALAEARRMETIGQLAGGLAHDLNNLLTVINGYADFALDELADPEQLRTDILEIRNAGERASEIVNHLLAYSRRQMLQVREVDVNRLLAEMAPDLRRALGGGIALELLAATQCAPVNADPGKLRQVLLELADNAREAMAGEGALTIEAGNCYLDAEFVRQHRDLGEGRYVRLTVCDTGSGMTQETLERIFEPFYTADSLAGSTGLGLAAAYGLIRQVGGSIHASSRPSAGTTFEIYLPEVPRERGSEQGSGDEAA